MDDYFLFFILGLPPLLLLLTALIPRRIAQTQVVMRQQPARALLLGMINGLFFGTLALFVESGIMPLAILSGFVLFFMLPLLLTTGLLISAGVVGEQFWRQMTGKSASPPGALTIGFLLMCFALLFPVIGWLVVLGLVLTGLGAAIITLFPGRSGAPQTSVEDA